MHMVVVCGYVYACVHVANIGMGLCVNHSRCHTYRQGIYTTVYILTLCV